MNPANNDQLHAGCWAEHADGTLLYVLGTENNRVLYELFDLSDTNNPVEFRDAMPQKIFEKDFSWDPLDKKSIKWTWHDKTLFPWDRIMKNFRQGVKPVAADVVIKDAERVKRVRARHAATTTGRVTGKKKHAANVPRSVAVLPVLPGTKSPTASKRKHIANLVDDTPRNAHLEKEPRTVAQRVAKERALKPTKLVHADVAHRTDVELPKGSVARRMRDRIQSAINKLRPGKGERDV
jgi:hypothetical protein